MKDSCYKIEQAIILCGGYGSRIKNKTQNKIPKSLIKVREIPFIFYLIIQIYNLNIKKIIFCTGFLGELIESDVSNFIMQNNIKIDYFFSKEKKLLGTGGAIRKSLNYINGLNSIVFNGDTYLKKNLNNLIKFHNINNSEITITGNVKFFSNRYGKLITNNNKLKLIKEKNFFIFSYVYSGVFMIKNELIKKCPLNKFINVEDIFFDTNLFKVLVWKNSGSFLDIGTENSLRKADHFLPKIDSSKYNI